MRKTDLAYAAGIIDGEGSIGLYLNRNKKTDRGYGYIMWVTVRNTNEWICQWLRLGFGGYVYKHEYRPEHPRWKDSWQWKNTSGEALEFLKLILPYLRLKRPQAEIAMAYQDKRQGQGHHLTTEELAIAEVQRIAVAALNKRGK